MPSKVEVFLQHITDEGLSEHRFVELGASFLTPSDRQSLESAIPALLEVASRRRRSNPKRAGQIEFLVRSLDADAEQLPEVTRRESSFTLLYFSRCSDLLPNPVPLVGFLDEEAALELVLSRHAQQFEEFCGFNQIDWSAVRPGTEQTRFPMGQSLCPI